ncbi:MAG: hypothetical protein PHP98_05975, partial [Kiritimatiellae bacterium]|nr:hypothetical protein [Kiritimatiellia bacterium]
MNIVVSKGGRKNELCNDARTVESQPGGTNRAASRKPESDKRREECGLEGNRSKIWKALPATGRPGRRDKTI